ncbi:MAG: hypothetical protein M1818_003658 [Claussenomyces sp. TS43310]|nr:MAG: hypothetical protein M1818_003658 [Claussenomyces sp. TS43310]
MERFRPLELSIYMPENRLSPILPHLGAADADEELMSYPPAVLMHVRSESALSSFAIPRKPLNSHSVSMGRHPHALLPSSSHSSAAKLRYKPLPARPDLRESLSADDLVAALQDGLPSMPPSALLRANTEPIRMLHRRNSEQVERVKSILHEKVALEGQLREIDSIIEERRSLYMSSRPASIYEESEEPMPDPTASPSLSFSRPKTAPSRPTVHIPLRSKSFSEASAAFTSPITPPNESLPPPLPLTLQPTRPPLRKKKSFSHISHWLFPGSGGSSSLAEAHARNISLDSVTNMPRPVTARDGFYQCVDPHSVARASTTSARSSISTVSTLETDRGELVTPPPTTTTAMTMMTAWTPESSPRPEKESVELTRMTTFGRQKVVAGSCEGCRGAIGRVEGDDCCRVSGVVGVAF